MIYIVLYTIYLWLVTHGRYISNIIYTHMYIDIVYMYIVCIDEDSLFAEHLLCPEGSLLIFVSLESSI